VETEPPLYPLYLYLYVSIVGIHCKRVDNGYRIVHRLQNMITYTKLFQSILDSTIWQESKETRLVWITMLAMVDRDGIVRASVPGLADRAKVGIEECKAALIKFKQPDEYSRSKEYDGRRIVDADGGWLLLNHAKYRAQLSAEERRDYQRVKQAQYRQRKKINAGTPLPGEAAYVKAEARGDVAECDRLAATPSGNGGETEGQRRQRLLEEDGVL
jgi:hypothetical protein